MRNRVRLQFTKASECWLSPTILAHAPAQQPAIASGAAEVHFLNWETQITWFSPDTSSTEGTQDCSLGMCGFQHRKFFWPKQILVRISPESFLRIGWWVRDLSSFCKGSNFFAFCTTSCTLHTFQFLFHPYSSQGPLLCCYSNLAIVAVLLQQILECDTSKGILFKGFLLLDDSAALTTAIPGEEVVTLAGRQKESSHIQCCPYKNNQLETSETGEKHIYIYSNNNYKGL